MYATKLPPLAATRSQMPHGVSHWCRRSWQNATWLFVLVPPLIGAMAQHAIQPPVVSSSTGMTSLVASGCKWSQAAAEEVRQQCDRCQGMGGVAAMIARQWGGVKDKMRQGVELSHASLYLLRPPHDCCLLCMHGEVGRPARPDLVMKKNKTYPKISPSVDFGTQKKVRPGHIFRETW